MNDTIILLLTGFSIITSIIGAGFIVLQKNRESRYNAEKQRIELDMLRMNLESQIYNLTEKPQKNSKQWEDSIHMQLSANKSSPDNSTVRLNSFLENAGLNEFDLFQERMVFVLTPFHPKFQEQYDLIKSVCEESGFKCIRGDEQNFKSDIFPHILKNIVKARIVIANITGRNPNVLYELGLAHALDKTTIIVSKLLDDVPVDIKSKKIVIFDDEESLRHNLKTELVRNLK